MSAPVEVLSRLLWIRDTAALPDQALADQLGMETSALTALVEAHPERFHESLVFPLTAEERQKIPEAPILAFTEAGAALLTGLLPEKESRLLSLLPAFAEARHLLTTQAELSARVSALEQKLELVLKTLQDEEEPAHEEHRIGFVPEDLPRGLKAKQRTAKKD
ncbi:hypothetical protein GETHLI_33050 [Geothrix limicola]|uniref:MarR family transcriptional regulator n=1 Tax=Geothrix limicola TaxID=2927978 RepID=A0ABQ5QKJ0_9BACT|nr:ORF6N domain-containing protein [Geothrix limicola]GLH74803.1 hypothetical protein GETHLI_33050 [Geothrix limicola]